MKILSKDIIKTFLILLIYLFSGLLFLYPIIQLFDIDVANISKTNYAVIDLSISLIQTVLCFIFYWSMFKSDFRKIIEETEKPRILNFIDKIIIGFIVFMLVKILGAYISSFVGAIFGIEELTSENQNTIEIILGSAPIMMICSAVLLAPIIEEVIFRGAIKKVIKNKRVFITVSGLIFGLMHVVDSEILMFEILFLGIILDSIIEDESKSKKNKIELSTFATVVTLIAFALGYYFINGNLINAIFALDAKELIAGISYIVAGSYLAYVYAKEKNIYYNIGIHALNNLFSMIMILFL